MYINMHGCIMWLKSGKEVKVDSNSKKCTVSIRTDEKLTEEELQEILKKVGVPFDGHWSINVR